MIQKIRVITTIGPDLKGESILSDIRTRLNIKKVRRVQSIKVYRLEGISEKEAKVLAEKLFSESINQKYTINRPIHLEGVKAHLRGVTRPVVIEIAYKPGVMNPEAGSIEKAAADLKIKLKVADSSHEYAFFGKVTSYEAEEIAKKLHLLNDTVEYFVKEEPKTLIIKGVATETKVIPIRQMADNDLVELSKDKLFLNLEEMKIIKDYFQKINRDPTDLELETLAQTWSEHCGHKTFKAKIILDGQEKEPLFTRLKKEALKHDKNIVSAFVDNAGVMDFYDGFAINGKAETHNAPSAIEPYGGAMTGSGGVFRDVVATGQGGKPVVSTDIFCLAPPDMDKSKLPAGTLPPDYILKRVVSAVKDYGNRIGIPTSNGSFHFHDDFRAKPIVLVGAYGILPKEKTEKGFPKKGDIAVVIGGRTGRDGIHGATFSSGEMSERTMEVNATAVQIGNAIEEKRIFDAILEARDKNLIRVVQDLGAGGFSSAIGETGEKIGVKVRLEKAPLKYLGLAPWEIWISESQERMVVVLAKNNLKKFLQVCQKYNVEATALAEFTGSKRLEVYFNKEKAADLEMKFLFGGLPQRVMKAVKPKPVEQKPETIKIPKNWVSILEKVLSHGDIASKEPILRMYDHNVQGATALHPFTGVLMDGPNDAVIVKPILDKPYGLIVAHGLNPILNKIDPYWGSIWAAAEAISNYVAVGGDYKNASLINNYIWPFPDEVWLGKLDTCVDAVVDFMKALQIPVISGKDSLSATYRNKDLVLHSPPTICISVFGKIPDVRKSVSSDFKKEGSTIVLAGKQDLNGMGGSAYLSIVNPERAERVEGPKVDLQLLPKVLEKIYKAINSGKVLSCHDISEGGLITALFEMCVGGKCGATIKTNNNPWNLFNETTGCFIMEVESEAVAELLFSGIPYQILGKTQKEEKIHVIKLFTANLDRLQRVWQKPMKDIFS